MPDGRRIHALGAFELNAEITTLRLDHKVDDTPLIKEFVMAMHFPMQVEVRLKHRLDLLPELTLGHLRH